MLVRWLVEPKRLSQEQSRELRGAVQRGEPLAISAITLLEIATLFDKASKRQRVPAQEILAAVDADAGLQVIPIDVEIAAEVAALRDLLSVQAIRAIVATARVHRLRLVTSDRRIIESKLVPVVE